MYAVIATGGKQYRIAKDDIIDIERVEGEVGKKVTFDEILVLGEGDKVECGTPLIKSAKVDAEIVEQFRGKKLTVFKMKRRKGFRKKHGHRQELTKVKITSISGAGKAAPKAEAKAEVEVKADEKKAVKAPAKKKTKKKADKE